MALPDFVAAKTDERKRRSRRQSLGTLVSDSGRPSHGGKEAAGQEETRAQTHPKTPRPVSPGFTPSPPPFPPDVQATLVTPKIRLTCWQRLL